MITLHRNWQLDSSFYELQHFSSRQFRNVFSSSPHICNIFRNRKYLCLFFF